MGLSDMQVFQDFAYESATETITQNVALFNEASRGAITLVAGDNEGDFSTETFWKNIPGLIRRRDPRGTGAVAAVALQQDATTSVRVAGGTPPIEFTPTQLTYIRKNPEEAGVVIGEQLGIGMTADYINSAIACAAAAIGNNAAVVTDGSAGAIERASLVTGASKFGDRAGEITAWIMHSKIMHDIYAENLGNPDRLFTIGNVNVMEDGFGRLLLMTDSPALVNTGVYSSLGLTDGAVSIEDNRDLFTNIETKNGDENIIRSMQSEYTFNAKVKGYSWDTAAGGASPDDATLGTGSNWAKVASSDKDTAGVLVTSQ